MIRHGVCYGQPTTSTEVQQQNPTWLHMRQPVPTGELLNSQLGHFLGHHEETRRLNTFNTI